MKNRNLIILAALLAVLVLISVAQRVGRERAAGDSDVAPVLAAEFVRDDINRVTLSYGGADSAAVVLEKLPDRWVVRSAYSHPADENRVTGLLDVLGGLQGEFRSDAEGVLADYGLGGDESLTITLFGADWQPVYTLEVGKQPSGGGGVFVRDPEVAAVFLTRGDVLGRVGLYTGPAQPQARHFLDLKVLQLDRLDIESIALRYEGGDDVVLEKVFAEPVAAEGDSAAPAVDRTTWEWRLTSPTQAAAAKTKCDAVLNALTRVTAVDVADPESDLRELGLWRVARRVEATLADGSVVEMRVGDLREAADGAPEGRFMMTGDDRTIWLLREYAVNQIFKQADELLPDAN